jgi:DNA-binding GntR family transcriptional regulator
VREFILEASMEGRAVGGRKVEEAVASKAGVSDRWVRDVLAKLRSEGDVFYREFPEGYEYWI